MPSHLRHEVPGGAEAVDAKPLGVPGGSERPVADQAGAEQGSGLNVGDLRRQREAVALVRHGVLGVAPVDVVAREPGPVAEILPAGPAVPALTVGPAEPGHAHSIARTETSRPGPGPLDGGHDLVAKYKGKLGMGELAVGHVQVGPADAAGPDPEQELARTGLGIGEVGRGLEFLERTAPGAS